MLLRWSLVLQLVRKYSTTQSPLRLTQKAWFITSSCFQEDTTVRFTPVDSAFAVSSVVCTVSSKAARCTPLADAYITCSSRTSVQYQRQPACMLCWAAVWLSVEGACCLAHSCDSAGVWYFHHFQHEDKILSVHGCSHARDWHEATGLHLNWFAVKDGTIWCMSAVSL